MTDMEAMVESFGVMEGLTKGMFQDNFGYFHIFLLTGRKNFGTIFMYNKQEKFIGMSILGTSKFGTLKDYKKSCGAIEEE